MFIVYQLALQDGKHYFGSTKKWRKQLRMEEHYAGVGSKWTRQYPPLEDGVVEIWEFPTRDEAYEFENQKTEEWLHLHGIDSARGGKSNYGSTGQYNWWVRKHLRYLVPKEYKWL